MSKNECFYKHCSNRGSWDCGDGYGLNCGICSDFKLDFDTLSDSQKERIHRILEEDESE